MFVRVLPSLVASLVAVVGCAHHPAGEVRFKNQAPVWRVNDRVPLTAVPVKREYHRTLYHTEGFVFRKLTRTMEVRDPVRARDVNALDEVPDSTWFTNRIGVRDVSFEELRRGPNVHPSPFAHRPWTITGMKSGGMSLGFTFEDALGAKYILKFDPRERPEMETAAHVVVHRILWACGYNVPEDHVGYVRREDLQIAPDAKAADRFGKEVKLTAEAVDNALRTVYRTDDGGYRVLASRFIPGKPLGPYPREGRRADDPNDVIPHELRRSLRGQYPIFAWLNHSDIQEDQTLDTFIADPEAPRRGHVVHYVLDFGKALGVMGYGLGWQTVGYTYRFDLGFALQSLLTLGLWERPWEGVARPELTGVGLFEAAHYDPARWRANSQYWPLEDKDRFDAFWGAKLLMRFTREQLATIVAEAQYTDPRAARYILDTLVARQRKTARYWFEQVAPLDRFTVDRTRLCFTDLLLAYELRRVGTRYTLRAFDHDGRALGAPVTLAAAPGGQPCAALPRSPSRDGYTIVRLDVARAGRTLPPVHVHLARDARGTLAVIGIRRE